MGSSRLAGRRDPVVGTTLSGDYRVRGLLYQSTLGGVYSAEHSRTRRALAVKILSPELCQDTASVERFQYEAEVLASLDHPHIVQVVDYNKTADGRPFLAMELLEGHTLETVLLGGTLLGLEEVISLATQTALALSAAHRQGIFHADLRPHNIFLITSSGRRFVKLLDFGFSRRVAEGAQADANGLLPRGEVQYLAPEQLQSEREPVSERTDQFALAAIVYEMLTGRAPFAAETAATSRELILTAEPTPPSTLRPGLPQEVEDALSTALSKDPQARFGRLADFIQVLSLSSDSAVDLEKIPNSVSSRPPSDARRKTAQADTIADSGVEVGQA